jgi:PKD repeat protein
MKKTTILVFVSSILMCYSSQAQVTVDYSKYPDYTPVLKPDYSLGQPLGAAGQKRARAAETLPAFVNNAQTPYFPAVFSQDGGSCGSASRIGYMFSHEINSFRGTDASLRENQYPTHFTWLLTNTSSGKEGMAAANGIPNRPTYGGLTYSTLFGNQDCGDTNYGWMQGYDRWYEAMQNRITSNANFPENVSTAEGRLAVKRWLYNHNGDTDFHSGGICGIGVASSLTMGSIGSTAANTAAGVVGKKYVTTWGSSVDHALTIVGYDDRIEFDLDGNGVYGETAKDEVGAWIIVNSWGSGWANGGFIYCPYKYGCPVGKSGNYWQPEIYYVRKNYRPLRTIKIRMDYSRRSELCIGAGIASDTAAKVPESTIQFEHFKYAGDGKNTTVAPEVPMLGMWADGLHYEPMEFGYDLTDLTANFDRRQPLKYFLVIDSKSNAIGTGKIYNCSIIDYEFDKEGVELPFEIDTVAVLNGGKRTLVALTVSGETVNAPYNLTLADKTLAWHAPVSSSYVLKEYKVYQDNALMQLVTAGTEKLAVEADTALYAVSAVYDCNGVDIESGKTNIATSQRMTTDGTNVVQMFSNTGFTVPDVFSTRYANATLEFWLYPTNAYDWNQQIGPQWGKFLMHTTSNRELVAGWNTGSDRFTSSTGTLTLNKWQHIAIVVKGNTMTGYVNGVQVGKVTSSNYSGLGGFGNLVFGSNGYSMAGKMDEVRIWGEARSLNQVKSDMSAELALPWNEANLLAYYKMDETADGGILKLRDCVGGHHATINATTHKPTADATVFSSVSGAAFAASFSLPAAPYYAGMPIQMTNASSPNVVKWQWNADGADVKDLDVASPVMVFKQAGTQTVTLKVTDATGNTAETSQTLDVADVAKPQADFSMTADELPAGERFSFINKTANAVGCTYRWEMKGAEVESVSTTNAAAAYPKAGTYTVTLTATNASGSSSVSKQVSTKRVASASAFEVTPSVIVKGQSVYLTDKSKYDPAKWNWLLNSDSYAITVDGQHTSVKPSVPGSYDVTLTTSNELGGDKATQKNVLTVCNADGEKGLRFGGSGETVKIAGLLDKGTNYFSIDYWMYPLQLSDDCNQIGTADSTLLITTNSTGQMNVTVDKVTGSSLAGYVVPSKWHHYAIAFKYGIMVFYRDGVKFSSASISQKTVPALSKDFCIGGSKAPMNAIIDEFRVWKKLLSPAAFKRYCMEPIAKVDSAETADSLLVYYHFNQSSGNVVDTTHYGRTGIRSGFGPEGDAWSNTLGIFCFNLNPAAPTNVTAKYLTNYSYPFIHMPGFVNGSSRFYALKTGTSDSGWILDNAVVDGSVTTGFHVDAQKGYAMTCTTQWDGFASKLVDHKAYQTITLPAGVYQLDVTNYTEFASDGSYIVAALGDTLPSTSNLSTALGYASLSDKELIFSVPQDGKVSLGFVVNLSGLQCITIGSITLSQKQGDVEKGNGETSIRPTVNRTGNAVHVTVAGRNITMETLGAVPVRIYNITGGLVFSRTVSGTATLTLPKGVYIINGRKIAIF